MHKSAHYAKETQQVARGVSIMLTQKSMPRCHFSLARSLASKLNASHVSRRPSWRFFSGQNIVRTARASHSPSLPVPMSWSSIARICAWADMFVRVLGKRTLSVSHCSWPSYFAHMQPPPPLQGLPSWAPPPQPTSPSRAS